ncbi:hypothetical protein [Alysiella crassa]|nr:hypothetical protein [Alysiella crassa]UOP06000.1 hypothetical protein LVJ80_09055 [Alysiella crassa]
MDKWNIKIKLMAQPKPRGQRVPPYTCYINEKLFRQPEKCQNTFQAA